MRFAARNREPKVCHQRTKCGVLSRVCTSRDRRRFLLLLDGLAIFLNTFVSLLFCHPPFLFFFLFFFFPRRSVSDDRCSHESACQRPGHALVFHENHFCKLHVSLPIEKFGFSLKKVLRSPPIFVQNSRVSAPRTDTDGFWRNYFSKHQVNNRSIILSLDADSINC